MGSQSRTRLSDWTELIVDLQCIYFCCAAVIWLYIYIFFHLLFHYGLLQDIEYSSLCCPVGPWCLSILYMSLYLLSPNSPSMPPAPPAWNRKFDLMFVSLSLFIGVFVCVVFYIPHTSDSLWYLSFSFWLTLYVDEKYSILCTRHLLYPLICWWTFRLFPCLDYCT